MNINEIDYIIIIPYSTTVSAISTSEHCCSATGISETPEIMQYVYNILYIISYTVFHIFMYNNIIHILFTVSIYLQLLNINMIYKIL